MIASRLVSACLVLSAVVARPSPPAAEAAGAGEVPPYATGWFDRYAPRDPATLVVPSRPVKRADYLELLRPYAQGFEAGRDHGQYGPRAALPALAVFAQTGDRALGEGIKQTLRHYGRWVDEVVAKDKGVFSEEGATLLAVHFRELRAKGLVTPDDEQWLRRTLLTLRQYQFGWKPGDGLWRGSQHRSVAQGANHLLAAALYPDEQGAAEWKAHGEAVWGDWWSFRDIGINDTCYFYTSLSNVLLTADLLGRAEVFTDGRARATLWERMVHETSPDGVLIPYAAHAGYHGPAGVRIWALELAARATRDGRYRYAASRLMNFGQARGFSPGQHHWHGISVEGIALAALACDDSVEPVRPETGSRLLTRPEIVRLGDAQAKERFPEAAGVESGMYMTERVLPHKLVFRAGWEPGDLYMLVEAYPRHDPLNPTAILALERHGSSFAEMVSEKFTSRENAVRIDDLSGRARFAGDQRGGWPKELPLGYDRMESDVEDFADGGLATHARLKVTNYMGFHASQTREVLFVKNRFVLVRDETAFDDAFRARVGPVWNTQNVGEPRGANWVNTWFAAHWLSGARLYENPPWDLLVYYAPRDGASLSVTGPPAETTLAEPQGSALAKLKVTQYAWAGDVKPGDRVQFAGLLLPHAPAADATPLAGAVKVLRDEPGLAAVALADPPGGGRWELAVLNATGQRLTLATPRGDVTTDAEALYLDLDGDDLARYWARAATLLKVGDGTLRQADGRGDAESPAGTGAR